MYDAQEERPVDQRQREAQMKPIGIQWQIDCIYVCM